MCKKKAGGTISGIITEPPEKIHETPFNLKLLIFAATLPAMFRPQFMRHAIRLARRGGGATSPNPMVGAVLVKGGKIIGRGWHRRAGMPHAEIEALRDAQTRGHSPKGATLYVTLEPCSTHGRTPPCTDAVIAAGIRRVVVGATDPNPKHARDGLLNYILTAAGEDRNRSLANFGR